MVPSWATLAMWFPRLAAGRARGILSRLYGTRGHLAARPSQSRWACGRPRCRCGEEDSRGTGREWGCGKAMPGVPGPAGPRVFGSDPRAAGEDARRHWELWGWSGVTARERVRAAFDCRIPDRVPIYQAGFSATVASQILGRPAYVGGGHAQYLEACALWEGPDAHEEYLTRCWRDAVDLCRALELDVVRTTYWRMPERPTRRIDEHTFAYGDETRGPWRIMRHDPASELYQVVARSPEPEATIDGLEPVVEGAEAHAEAYRPGPETFDAVLRAQAEFGDDGVPYGGIPVGLGIPREPVWLEATALRPDLVGRYLATQAIIAERNVALGAALGLTYAYGGGDFCSPRGPMYSPRAFHELVLPQLERVSRACDAAGALHGFASDGNLWPVADDLFGQSGVRFFYEVDCLAGMDLTRLRTTFPHLALLGGINSATLHQGTVEQVIGETRRALRAAREHGGCVIGCSNQIVAGTPMANFWAMMETLEAER